jgi:predicted dehydrogenase
MSPLNIAIVGTGLIGPRHAKAVLQDPEAQLVCIVDPNPVAKSVAEELGTVLYASIQDMLVSNHKPDAAIVCTPNHTHVAVSKELLDGGVHVLVEKPISGDVASGLDLVWNASFSSFDIWLVKSMNIITDASFKLATRLEYT